MSMMMPPDYAPGLPTPPGGGDAMMGGPAPPQDALSGMALPSQGGMDGLLAALGGGGDQTDGGAGAGGDQTAGPSDMSAIDHIQEAMKHLMMALSLDQNETNNLGVTKGLGALQGILAGHQKAQQAQQADQSSQSGGGGGGY